MQIEKGFAYAGDIKIAYQCSGRGEPLVCCHAMGWNQSLWDEHRARFSENHQLITFDQRGSGDSDHPPFLQDGSIHYTADKFADDLCAVLDHLGLESAMVLGYSMGAIAAMKFAARSPSRVTKLVLVSAMASRLPQSIIDRARVIEDLLYSAGIEETYWHYFSGPLFDGVKRDSKFENRLRQIIAKASVDGFQGCFRVTIDRPSLVSELDRITAATLVIVGEHDAHYLNEADLLAEKIPDARRFTVLGAGHALNVQRSKIFESAVLDFIAP